MKIHIPVLLGTVRHGRQSEKVARYVAGKTGSMKSVTTELLDLASFHFPVMLERMDHSAKPIDELVEFSERLRQADGLVIVAPEYKNGYPGSLKNALDYLDPGILKSTPIGICTVSSGDFGGLNCLAQLRLVCLALGGTPIPARVAVSRVTEAFDDDGNCAQQKLERRIEGFLSELVWHTEAFAAQRLREETRAH